MHVCMYMYVCVCVCVYVCMYLFMYVCMYVCLLFSIYAYLYIHVQEYVKFICKYVYTYTYLHMYKYMYIYIYVYYYYYLYTEYINEEWIMKHVWNNDQLMNNKNEIQKSLIHHIVDDRLQEGTLVTDLIDSIKSPFTTPQQLVSESLINIVLIYYYVNCIRRHREYWRRRYLRMNQNY